MFDVPAVDHVSPVSPAQAAEIALARYGVAGTAERLASEHDDTFRVAGADGVARLLKISVMPDPVAVAPGLPLPASPGVAPGFQTALLLQLARVAPDLPVQRVITTLDGRPELTLSLGVGAGEARLVRMTSWLDGQLLGREAASAGLRREIGATLARLNIALRGFAHPGARRTHPWDLQNFGALRPLLDALPESGLLPSVGQALRGVRCRGGLRAAGGARGLPRSLRRGGAGPPWRTWRRRSFTPISTGRTCSPTPVPACGSSASSTSATRWPGRSRWTWASPPATSWAVSA